MLMLRCVICFVINVTDIPNVSSCFQDEIARLSVVEPEVKQLHEQLLELKEKEETQVLFDADIAAFQDHYQDVLADLKAREKQLVLGEKF